MPRILEQGRYRNLNTRLVSNGYINPKATQRLLVMDIVIKSARRANLFLVPDDSMSAFQSYPYVRISRESDNSKVFKLGQLEH